MPRIETDRQDVRTYVIDNAVAWLNVDFENNSVDLCYGCYEDALADLQITANELGDVEHPDYDALLEDENPFVCLLCGTDLYQQLDG